MSTLTFPGSLTAHWKEGKHFLIAEGWVRSSNDHQYHYVDRFHLMKFYQIKGGRDTYYATPENFWKVMEELLFLYARKTRLPSRMTLVTPRANGDYSTETLERENTLDPTAEMFERRMYEAETADLSNIRLQYADWCEEREDEILGRCLRETKHFRWICKFLPILTFQQLVNIWLGKNYSRPI